VTEARTLHLVGSPESAFWADLSVMYARRAREVTGDVGPLAHVEPGGAWRFPASLDDEAIAAAAPMALPDAVATIAGLGVDVMVPHLFDRAGMTDYRALFDIMAIPYVGNAPDVMALAADKAKTKAVVAAAGVAVPAGEVLRAGEVPTLGLPVVVKPLDSDNSLGVSLVRDPGTCDEALRVAFEHSDRVLVEAFVPLGREVRCGILERAGELVCLPLEEYAVDQVRGYADKLAPDPRERLRLVAKDATRAWIVDPGDPVTETVWAAARRCHTALGCRHYSLFDFRIDPDGRPWFIEAGLYCSFSDRSVIATMAAAAGIGTDDLYRTALQEAMTP
jgi:D-alanine-D-alanine ligase